MKFSKIIPIIVACLFLCFKMKAQIIFYQNFNDTVFYKTWKVSEKTEHAKQLEANQTKFVQFHPTFGNIYAETPIIPIIAKNNYCVFFDWNKTENNGDSIQLLLSKDDGVIWQNIKTLKNANTKFWLRDSIALGELINKDSIMLRWQYFVKKESPIQTFNLDNIVIKSVNNVLDSQNTIHEFEVKIISVPTKSKIKIECKNLEGKMLQLRMYAKNGIVLKNITLPVSKKNKIEIDVAEVSKGAYFISVESSTENYTQQIIIDK